MYQILLYETPAGNIPLNKFIIDLAKQHKTEKIISLKDMLDDLKIMGLDIDKKHKKAIKYITEQIYELRPDNVRVFFFMFDDDKIIILHGFEKKTQKTPKREIDKAKGYKKDYLSRIGK